jgi:hypothetical protein
MHIGKGHNEASYCGQLKYTNTKLKQKKEVSWEEVWSRGDKHSIDLKIKWGHTLILILHI